VALLVRPGQQVTQVTPAELEAQVLGFLEADQPEQLVH
jgi:hypothetical protein